MESREIFVNTINYYYYKLCCNKYISNKTQLDELNEYSRNFLIQSKHITWTESSEKLTKNYLTLDFVMKG